MSVWQTISRKISSFAHSTGMTASLASLLNPEVWLMGGRDAAFTLSLVALSAKMAAADGVVTADEIRAFRENVQVPPEANDQIERIFHLAQQDVAGFETYARRIARLFADERDTLEHILDGLFHIAEADGLIHEDELAYLQKVSALFGFTTAEFRRFASRHVILDEPDPYFLLGVEPDISDEELKRVYRKLVIAHHPDRMIAKGVPENLVQVTSRKMAAINAAYEVIRDSRAAASKKFT